MALEKLKTITSSIPETFDREFNQFVSNPNVNVVKVDLQTTSQTKRTIYTAYIFYVAKEDWKKYLEAMQRLQPSTTIPEPASKPKRGRPKKNAKNNIEIELKPEVKVEPVKTSKN